MSQQKTTIAAKIMAKAWTDNDFRKLLADDSETLCKEAGLILDINMTFVNDVAGNLLFIVPSKPKGFENMSQMQLEEQALKLINGN